MNTEQAHPSRLVALSVLELDLPTLVTGWGVELDRRHIQIVQDDIGRDCIARADARGLISEFRDLEARKVQTQAETERRAIEQDQQFRASLNPGIPWYLIGRDIAPAAAILEAQQDADYAGRPRSVAAELLEAELAGKTSLEYHPIRDEEP